MSRFPRAPTGDARSLRRARAALLALNVGLLAWAAWLGGGAVTDGEGSVTTGFVVAAGIAATIALALLLRLVPLPGALRALLQAYALGAQALHALGHLASLYYVVPFYDDLLHFGLVLGVGLLALELARAGRFLFTLRGGGLRVGALVWLVATAAAGLWEIFEFVMDELMGTREQDNLADTMVDMIDGTLGGAVAGVLAGRHVRARRRAKALADARSDELLD